ncbi:MAG: hypothetical protein GY827_11335 [Cytophagales bacterium]|nr:hypothetical protein [Cytophagales bacterium]
MRRLLPTLGVIFSLAFLWSCGDDVEKYTKEEYTQEENAAFQKKRDSVLFYQYKENVTSVAKMYCDSLNYTDISTSYSEIKAEMDKITGTFYSVDIPFTRSISDAGLQNFLKQDDPYFVIFTRKTMVKLAPEESSSNSVHMILDVQNEGKEAPTAKVTPVINNPVAPILEATSPTDPLFTTKAKNALKEVYGSEYIFILSQLSNNTPTITTAGNYYGVVTVVNTYDKKIVASYPIAFLYQEMSDLEGDLHSKMKKYLKRALGPNTSTTTVK